MPNKEHSVTYSRGALTTFWDPTGSWTLSGAVRIPVNFSYRADDLSGTHLPAPSSEGSQTLSLAQLRWAVPQFLYSGIFACRGLYDLQSSILLQYNPVFSTLIVARAASPRLIWTHRQRIRDTEIFTLDIGNRERTQRSPH